MMGQDYEQKSRKGEEENLQACCETAAAEDQKKKVYDFYDIRTSSYFEQIGRGVDFILRSREEN